MRILELGRETARTWWLLAALLLACVSAKESPQAGGESHFLRRCDDTCGSGLACIQGVCTRGCVVGEQSCSDLSADAICTGESGEPDEMAVCDLVCKGTGDCTRLSASHRCEAGFCRAPTAVSVPSGSVPTDEVFVCPKGVTSDPVDVTRALILGSELQLRVSYGGNCKLHAFALCFGPEIAESYPVQTTLRVIHDDQGDTCNSVGSQELTFDLTPLAEHYERSYRSKAGLVETNYGLYAFGPLSCEDRTLAGQSQLARYEQNASLACTSADDCQHARNDTRCSRGCGTVVSKEGAAELASWLSVMDEAVCGDYPGDGCLPLPGLQCPAVTIACVAGRCQDRSP